MRTLIARMMAIGVVLSVFGACRASADDPKPGFGKRSLEEWVKQLNEGTPAERAIAATVLGEIGRGGRSQEKDPPFSKHLDELYRNNPGDLAKSRKRYVKTFGIDLGSGEAKIDLEEVKKTAKQLKNSGIEKLKDQGELLLALYDKALKEYEQELEDLKLRVVWGASPAAVLPPLKEALKDGEKSVRYAAAVALSLVDARNPDCIPIHTEALKDRNSEMRARAAWALSRVGPKGNDLMKDAVPPLTIAVEKDPESSVRMYAATALGSAGPATRAAIPKLIAALGDKEPTVQAAAARGIGGIGPDAKAALPQLITFMKGPNLVLRNAAALGAVGLGPDGIEAIPDSVIPELITLARTDKSSSYRESTIDALSLIGRKLDLIGNALVEIVQQDSEADVRKAALLAFARIGDPAKPFIASVIPLTYDPKAPQKAQDTDTLVELGPVAVPALVAELQNATRNGSNDGFAIAKILGRIGEPALGDLTAALRNKEIAVRRAATEGLAELGPKAKPALAALSAALKDRDIQVRRGAITAICSVGTEAIPELTTALSINDFDIRVSAVEALANFGKGAAPSAPKVIPLVGSPNLQVRLKALTILGNIGPDAKSAGPAVALALQDDKIEVRVLAAQTLVKIEAIPKDVVPRLLLAYMSKNADVKKAAGEALKAIDLEAAKKAGIE